MDKNVFIQTIRKEIEESTGCTDPGSVTLAVSKASKELKRVPEKIVVTVSENVYKNGVSVGIPGTGKKGLYLAAALGAVIDKSEKGLAILNYIDEKAIKDANKIVDKNIIEINHAVFPNRLYIKAEVWSKENSSYVIIMNDYSNIVEVGYNDKIVFNSYEKELKETSNILIDYKVEDLFDLILNMELEDLNFLIVHAKTNKRAALEALENNDMKIGKSFLKEPKVSEEPFSAINKVKTMTAAAGEARMMGLNVPIMAIAGSGNHGITNFLGILSVAESLGSSDEDLAKALAISSMITIYIKGYIKRMTAFCGCGVAAATGVAAGTVYLLGGSYNDCTNAMQSIIGTLAGMFCDGAKESCAYKLSTSASIAVQFAYLAMDDCYISNAMGIVGNTIEETFKNLGDLNNPGMLETDKVILKIIEKNIYS